RQCRDALVKPWSGCPERCLTPGDVWEGGSAPATRTPWSRLFLQSCLETDRCDEDDDERRNLGGGRDGRAERQRCNCEHRRADPDRDKADPELRAHEHVAGQVERDAAAEQRGPGPGQSM